MDQPITKLSQFSFSDLYLTEDNNQSWLKGVPGEGDPYQIPESVVEDLDQLRKLCVQREESTGLAEFTLPYDGINYRASKMPSVGGVVYVLRRQPEFVPGLDSLGFSPWVVERLTKGNPTGLMIISGATGSGKTTTASAIVKARLAQQGGIAITAEDPPEMPLHGRHGGGVCFQTSANRDAGGYAEASRLIVRWNPNIIFLGEIRDSEVASEALRASVNGHLVISTMHADSVSGTLNRILSLVTDMEAASATLLLADGLHSVIHQKWFGEGEMKVVVQDEFLFVAEHETAIRSTIRNAKFEHLGSDTQAQKNSSMLYSQRKS